MLARTLLLPGCLKEGIEVTLGLGAEQLGVWGGIFRWRKLAGCRLFGVWEEGMTLPLGTRSEMPTVNDGRMRLGSPRTEIC